MGYLRAEDLDLATADSAHSEIEAAYERYGDYAAGEVVGEVLKLDDPDIRQAALSYLESNPDLAEALVDISTDEILTD